MVSPLTIAQVNSLSENDFKTIFANVIEHYPEAAVCVKDKRPFQSVNDLCDEFSAYLEKLRIEEKVEVLTLHPDLAGRLAGIDKLTVESAGEQKAAGLQLLTPEQKNTIDENNQRYRMKFKFPFIICARENKIQSIMEGLQNRYDNTYEQEVNIGINEVKKICKLRILDIVGK